MGLGSARRWPILIGVGVTVLCALLTIWPPVLLERAREAVFDSVQRFAPRPYDPASPVHVIDIDEAALEEFGQWPWPRTYLAALTDRLFAHGAAAVAFDVLFAEPDRTSPERIVESWARFGDDLAPDLSGARDHDAVFAEALAGQPVILAVTGTGTGREAGQLQGGVSIAGDPPTGLQSFPGAVLPIDPLREAAAGLGTITPALGTDSVVRAVPMVSRIGEAVVPSLTAELLRVAQGAGSHLLRTSSASGDLAGGRPVATALRTGAVTLPLEADGTLRVYFAGQRAERVTPAAAVLG
ncbi:MAG: CHASE2 domain-containing protein, partial [Pseudomonadota bacterium]